MAVEARRGCGFRKVGGLYLCSSGIGFPCDRLPIRMDVCPTCNHGFKQTRAWTWIDVPKLVEGQHFLADRKVCECPVYCPLCWDPKAIGKSGLLWIGEKFYKTPAEFVAEGVGLGISRRIVAVPRGFEVGKSWVLLAHPKTIHEVVPEEERDPNHVGGELINGVEWRHVPGVFYVWKPTAIEKICKESERGSEAIAELVKKGITPVFVPDDDRDHMGSVYDAAEEEAETVAGK